MNASGLALLTLFLVPACASTQAVAPEDSCPVSAATAPVSFSHLHQIPTSASDEDVSHTIITPGGMILHSPEMVAATDLLTVFARDADAMCFHLFTLAKERRKCEFAGIARKQAENSYEFAEGSAAVRFTFIGEDQVEVTPLGTGYRSRCEPSGSIAQATYTLSAQSQ